MTLTDDLVATYVAKRAHLRALLATGQFDALDALLDEAALRWLNGPSEPYTYSWSVEVILDPCVPSTDRVAQLRAWVDARPGSYHAHLLTGRHREHAASRIRTADGGQYVAEDRWVGAELARDLGLAAYPRAIGLHARPAYALTRMFRLTSYLGEPAWLLALARGDAPQDYAARCEEIGPEAWAAGLARLKREGGDALAVIPNALPLNLPARAAVEWDDGKDYWLRATLQARPQDFAVRNEYVHFLYPRWGGGHEEMSEFIDGPGCAALSVRERNALRVTQAWDYLGYAALLPDEDDTDAIADCRQAFEELIALDLEPDTQARVLREYAQFLCTYAQTDTEQGVEWDQADMQRAYDMLVLAWQVGSPVTDPSHGNDALSTLISCVDFAHIEDTAGLLALWLDRSQQWGDDLYAVLLAAMASKFGFYGIAQNQFDHEALLVRARSLESDTDLGQAGADLFGSVSEAAGIYLMREAAQWGNASAMAGLPELYSGALSRRHGRDADTYSDPVQYRYWTERAADAGDPICQYNTAHHLIRHHDPLSPEQYQRARSLLFSVLHMPNVDYSAWTMAARELATLLLFSDIEADRRLCLDVVLRELWIDHGDDNRVMTVASYYAHAFQVGCGCAQNSYLAKVWVDRGQRIEPDNAYLADRADEIYQRTGLMGEVRAKIEFGRAKQAMDARDHALTFEYDADEE